MRGQPAHTRDAFQNMVILFAKDSDIVQLVFPLGGPNEAIIAMGTKIQCILTILLRERDNSAAFGALWRTQGRTTINHLNCLGNFYATAIFGNVLAFESKQLLHTKTGAQKKTDTVPDEGVGEMFFQRIQFHVREGILAAFLFNGHILSGFLCLSGRVGYDHLVGFGSVENLNQHGTAFRYIRLRIPFLIQFIEKLVDMKRLDILDFIIAKMRLTGGKGIPVVCIGGGLHLSGVILIPCVSPTGKRGVLGERVTKNILFVFIFTDFIQQLCFGRCSEANDTALTVIMETVHELSAPGAAGKPLYTSRTIRSLCHCTTSLIRQTDGNIGVLFYPRKERLPGDTDAGAEATHGEVLTMGQFIGRRLANIEIVLYLGNGHIHIGGILGRLLLHGGWIFRFAHNCFPPEMMLIGKQKALHRKW